VEALTHLTIQSHKETNKTMYTKIIYGLTITLISVLASQNIAYSIPTRWEQINVSLNDLLNSGWQLLGVSSNRVAFRNSISPGGLDEETYTFTLVKNGKYIVCAMTNPYSPVATSAACRKIN
jgi:hypothetical protein